MSFQKLTQREHILKRPDMYIGNTQQVEKQVFVYENKELVKKSVSFIPGVLKCFDEVFTNCLDHANRVLDNPVTKIKVSIEETTGIIKIENNGQGIPNTDGIPEMIFSQLLTSSNYDDSVDRFTAGTNGLGVKLTNVFSKRLKITCCCNQQKYVQTFQDNMSLIGPPKKSKHAGADCTIVEFELDWDYFNISKQDRQLYYNLFYAHVLVGSLSVSSVSVVLFQNNEKIVAKSKSLKEFINNFIGCDTLVYTTENESVAIVPAGNELSLVNGCVCSGKFIQEFYQQLVAAQKKPIPGFAKLLKDTCTFICVLKINQPRFSSQSKEFCTTSSPLKFSAKFLNQFSKSLFFETIQNAAAALDEKKLAKKDGKKRQTISVPKLDDATFAGTKKAQDCCLYLTEGDSAKTFVVSGFSVIGRQYNGVFPLKGKVLNVLTATQKQIMENEEINHIKKILGLKVGVVYTKESIRDLRYGHVRVLSDQDTHGIHIRGLVFNFFHTFWPELLQLGYLSIMQTPLIKGTGPNGTVYKFYTEQEFQDCDLNLKNIKYYKGLGGSTSSEAKEAFRELETNKIDMTYTERCAKALKLAFAKDKIEDRKKWISSYVVDTEPVRKVPGSSYDAFVNYSLVQYSVYSNVACIPDCIDGLKPSQRKILYTLFTKVPRNQRIKVAQLGASVAEHSSYHHGEASLFGAIINMAATFPGSNNHNLLIPDGQFGSRITNGADAASPRYIFTQTSPFASLLFPGNEQAAELLQYKTEEGNSIEPVRYYPVLPLVLINGCQGIGTGYSTYIPPFNMIDIIDNLLRLSRNKELIEMKPYWNNFTGVLTSLNKDNTKYKIDCIPEIIQNKIIIKEIPLNTSFTQFAELLTSLSDTFKVLKNASTEETLYYELKWISSVDLSLELVMKLLKLSTSVSLENMYLFHNGKLEKFYSPLEILSVFYKTRLAFLEKKRLYSLSKMDIELKELLNQQRFIELILSDDLNLKTISVLNAEAIEQLAIDYELTNVTSLLQMKLNRFTQQELLKLESKINKIKTEKTTLETTTNLDMFKADLETLK